MQACTEAVVVHAKRPVFLQDALPYDVAKVPGAYPPVRSIGAIKLCEAHCVAVSAYHNDVSGLSRVRRSGGLVDRASADTVDCPASALRLAPTTHPALPRGASGGTAEDSPDRCRSPEH